MSFSASGHRACPKYLLIRQSGFRPKQIILVTTLLDLNAILKAKSLSALSSALASDGSQFQAPQNHVKHGDDLGKITAEMERKSDASLA